MKWISGSWVFLSVVDHGTSILVDTQTQAHYEAQSTLFTVAKLLLVNDAGELAGLIHLVEDELEPLHARLREAKGSSETKLALMDGSDRAEGQC